MWSFNRFVTACFDAFFSVMESWPGWLSLTILSGITGVGALFAYKYTSNQAAIGKVSDDIKANLLAAKLFKDNLSVTLKSQGRLFWAAARLFALSMQPMAVMIVPMGLLLFQMAMRYEWRPLMPGETTILTVELHSGTPEKLDDFELVVPDGIEIEVGPSRIYQKASKDHPERNEVAWRLRPTQAGNHVLTVRFGDESARKKLVVSDGQSEQYVSVSPIRPGNRFADKLLYPIEEPAAADDLIQCIAVDLPPGSTPVFGWDMHWVITWLIASMILALIVKPFLNVKMW